MFLTPFHKTMPDGANFEHFRMNKQKCYGEQPSCGRCSEKGRLCQYGNTEYEDTAQRADAFNEWRRQQAYARAASAPQHRPLQPRSKGSVKPLRKLAAAPVSSPSFPEQINQTQFDPVQSTANLLGSDRFTETRYTLSNYTNTPTDYTSNIYSPAVYTPSSYTSTYHAPTYHAPTYHAPAYDAPAYDAPTYHTPTQTTPAQLDLAQIGQNQFDPNGFGETLGNWDLKPERTSQYPRLESLPDELFQYPQESPFAQREISQLPSGPLQYDQAFDSTYGAPIVQPDWNTSYVNYQNMVRPSVPIWSETDMPAQSVPWSEPMSNDFGLGSINLAHIAQTPAEYSHHVEQERSLGYIDAASRR